MSDVIEFPAVASTLTASTVATDGVRTCASDLDKVVVELTSVLAAFRVTHDTACHDLHAAAGRNVHPEWANDATAKLSALTSLFNWKLESLLSEIEHIAAELECLGK